MELEKFGFTKELQLYRTNEGFGEYKVGRIISEHKERYVVKTEGGEFDAEIIGNLRFSAKERADFPAVGDWVAVSDWDRSKLLIHHVFPRQGCIERQAVGKFGGKQIIASNIDCAFIVQSADRDFNVNRIERYLTICNQADVKAIVVLTKIDQRSGDELKRFLDEIHERIPGVPVYALSNTDLSGFNEFHMKLEQGKTYCMLGSSGVGKSSLVNNLLNTSVMATGLISDSTHKGRHVTTHRELFVLDNGSVIIDNPGMREVGIADSQDGIGATFGLIELIATDCRYRDCTHTGEAGCAVVNAVKEGEIDSHSYENYLKMLREKDHFEADVFERRKKEKSFGRMVKSYKKSKNRK